MIPDGKRLKKRIITFKNKADDRFQRHGYEMPDKENQLDNITDNKIQNEENAFKNPY